MTQKVKAEPAEPVSEAKPARAWTIHPWAYVFFLPFSAYGAFANFGAHWGYYTVYVACFFGWCCLLYLELFNRWRRR